ncbi:class I SAM-dependent methyltransferase [Herbaspirillum lusitanum]|uniref:class I SAM-dependent methyltransferase n=1 Tax=Herbaspirillum lusitanum TaxID=213312 RepID=UPI0022376C62|nr:class I SAM-dependent methyltransferase [Herbaspirillum lusitanum]MCW5296894.1 class I SAM-dependent methyltransferase [Herbaspirillum lusitanum]
MTASLRKILSRFPRLKQFLRKVHQRFFSRSSVSSSYEQIQVSRVDEETSRLRSSWQSELLPARQRELVERQLAEYRRGKSIDVFDVMVFALQKITTQSGRRSLLEVGCSSAFYSEVLKIKQLPFVYSGCDYSPAFIDLGRKYHPDIPLSVQDATALNFGDEVFDVVVSGCCLLHIPEFEKAIAETARVAKEFAIFHRTPVVEGLPHQYFRKQAYGVETVEIHFNEMELLDMFRRYSLECIDTFTLSREPDPATAGAWHANRTYVCRKTNNAS